MGKIAVFDERFQLVPHAYIGSATRERRTGDTRCLLGDGFDALRL
jgi:hypothetical protein